MLDGALDHSGSFRKIDNGFEATSDAIREARAARRASHRQMQEYANRLPGFRNRPASGGCFREGTPVHVPTEGDVVQAITGADESGMPWNRAGIAIFVCGIVAGTLLQLRHSQRRRDQETQQRDSVFASDGLHELWSLPEPDRPARHQEPAFV